MTSIIKWMSDLYMKQIDTNVIDGSKTFKSYINSVESFPYVREIAFINLKYGLSMNTSGYTYTTFRAGIKNNTIIYSVVYFKDNKPVFVALSPSYESSKGEFRDSFITYTAFENTFKKYTKELEYIENIILKSIKDSKLEIITNIFPKKTIIDMDLEMMAVRLLTASVYLIAYRYFKGIVQQHIHKVFFKVVTNLVDISSISIKDQNIYNGFFKSNYIRAYGQKLIPLTVGEAVKINDIYYPTWRELFISYATADMVINGISPNFPISANWTYIEGCTEHTYDNSIIKDKYERNKEVVKFLDQLKTIYKESDRMSNMEDSRERIRSSIDYITFNKLLSTISISRIDEFAGITFTSVVPSICNSQVVPPHYHQMVTDIKYFDKIMFDLMYATHVLHSKIGVVHMDLHLNNITINNVDSSFYDQNTYKYAKDKKYGTAFIVEHQRETYIFPYDGYYGTVIDFSDSLISKKFMDYSNKYIKHINFDNIIESEKDRIFNKLSKLLTYVTRNKDKVKASIVRDYDLMFKVMTSIDYVHITRNIKLMFERGLDKPKLADDKRAFYVDDKIIKRLEYMEERSLEFMLSYLQKVVNGDIHDVPFVGDVLLPEFFKSYMYDSEKSQRLPLYEVYKYDANWNSSVVLYEDYPIWAKREKVAQKIGNTATEELFGSNELSEDSGRDIHLTFLIEAINSKYGLEVGSQHSSNIFES